MNSNTHFLKGMCSRFTYPSINSINSINITTLCIPACSPSVDKKIVMKGKREGLANQGNRMASTTVLAEAYSSMECAV